MLYNIVMLLQVAVTILGILIFLFVFWKRLKEDYASEIIFTTSFYILSGIFVASLVSARFLHDWYLWIAFGAGIIGLYLGTLRFKLRFYETFEAFVVAGLPWLSLLFLEDSAIHSSLSSFLGFLAILIAIFVFYWLDTHYREFTWYRSGKVGFTGLATLALIFVVRAATSAFRLHVISCVSNFEAALSTVAAIVCLGLLYNLSRKIE